MKKKVVIICSVIILIAAFIVIFGGEKKDKNTVLNKEKIEKLNIESKDKGDSIDINLYFNGGKNENDVKIVKEERLVNREELFGEVIVQELIKGPAVNSESKPIFPKDTRVLSFSIKDGIAYLNLSYNKDLKITASEEKALLTCLSTSLSQLESVRKLMLTVENQTIQSLGGNYDISKPFSTQEIDSLKIAKGN